MLLFFFSSQIKGKPLQLKKITGLELWTELEVWLQVFYTKNP